MRRFLLIAICCLPVSVGCGLKKAATSLVGELAWGGQGVLEREPDVELARETTPALLVELSAIAANHPKDRTFSTLLAKGYGQYAYGFFEEDLLRLGPKGGEPYATSLARASRFYHQGMDAGLTALRNNGSFRRAETGTQAAFEKALRTFGKHDVDLLFWTAFCWGGWLNLHRDDPEAIVDLPRVSALIDRVLELTPRGFFGAAESFRGVLDASRPPLLGGNPPRAKAAFDQAIAVEPRYLITKVLYAQYYAVQVQDRVLFKRLLGEVVAADAGNFPEQRLANELAKRRAHLLLRRENEWF